MVSWIEKCKQKSTFESAATHLGITQKGGRYGPCPACTAEQTGSSDKRFPIGRVRGSSNPTGWRCFACAAGGDMMDLVAFSLEGCKFREVDDYSRIRDFFNVKHFETIEVVTPEKKLLPENDLSRLMSSMQNRKVSEAQHRHINEYLTKRGIDADGVDEAFVFDHHFSYNSLKKINTSNGKQMAFWPYSWARDYPICVPLYDEMGKQRSFQGRAITKLEHGRKTNCPAGHSTSGLVFACENARAYLRGESSFKTLWVVEGEMDFLCLKANSGPWDQMAVIGVKNGSHPFFNKVKFPAGSTVVIATHNDEKGDEYAEKIAKAIYPHKPKRLIIDQGDINDAMAAGLSILLTSRRTSGICQGKMNSSLISASQSDQEHFQEG
jgi:DNA primase